MELLENGPKQASSVLLLAHGAGAAMDTAFMAAIAEGVAAEGVRVVRFEFPYMAERRETGKRRGPDPMPVLQASLREAAWAVGRPERLVVGGKSLGGRVASLVADELGVRGLVGLGYPFHPPGKPEKLRTAHLKELRTPALLLQGTRDPFGRPEEVERYELSDAVRVVWVEDGDHSLKPRKRSGRTEPQNLALAAAEIVRFLESV